MAYKPTLWVDNETPVNAENLNKMERGIADAVVSVNGITPDENGNVEVTVSGGNVDLTGYATEQYVQDYAQPKGNYLTEHQDISGKLDASALPPAINAALAQAKASGEFDGKDGKDGSNGKDGSAGSPGADGVSPTVAVSKSGKVTTVSITDKNGTKTATINDGADGSPGSAGKDGISVTHSWSGTTLNITSASGTSSANLKGDKGDTGAAGADGKDYVLTAADRAEIVQAVLDELGGQPVRGVVDENNNIVISGSLADGTYTLKYENADGTYTEIGTFDVGAVGPAYTNLFDPAAATLNQRWSNSSYGYKATNGYVVSDYIPVSAISTDTNNPTIMRFRGGEWAGDATLEYFNASKGIVASATASTDGTGTRPSTEAAQTDGNGDSYIRVGYKNGSVESKWQSGVAYVRLCLRINSTATAITAADVQNIIITINEPIVG